MLPTRTRPLGGGDLPAGYTRLEYLEATGEQYINTGVPLSSELDLRVDFAPVFTGSAHVLFGTRRDDIGSNRGAYAQIMPTVGQIVIWRHTRRMALQGVSQARHTLELTGTSLALDGTVKSTYTEDPWSYTQPCYLGAAITHAGVVQLPLVGRLYGFTLKQSGSKKLNLIPALDPAGRPCMFDTIARTPFYNAGTGADFLYA